MTLKNLKTLKNLGFLIGFSVTLTSCENEEQTKAPADRRMELDTTSQFSDQHYRIYTLEGCEYLVVGYGKDRWGSHKGNCKNPIHSASN